MKARTQLAIFGTTVGLFALLAIVISPRFQSQADINPPARPTDVRISLENGAAVLTWSPGEGPKPTAYRIYRSISSTGKFTRINRYFVRDKSYKDESLDQNTTYWYKISAIREVKRDGRRQIKEGSAAGPISIKSSAKTKVSPQPTPSVYPTPSPSPSNPTVGTGRTFYVSPSGNNTKDCLTSAAACSTVAHALTKTVAGNNDTILLSGSGLLEGFSLKDFGQNLTDDQAKTKPLIIRGENQNINFKPNGQDTISIFLQNTKGVTFDGIAIENTGRNNLRAIDSDYLTIKNSTFSSGSSACLLIVRSDNVLIDSIVAKNSDREHGIYISDKSNNVTIQKSHIFNNGAAGIQVNSEKLPGDNGKSLATNVLIEGNAIYNNGWRGGSAINFIGVQDSTVQNNFIINNYATGIAAIWRDEGTPSRVSPAGGPKNIKILHNTIAMAKTNPKRTASIRYAVQFIDSSGQNEVKNNIIYNPNGKALEFNRRSNDAATIASDHNVFKVGSETNLYDGKTIISLASWQKGIQTASQKLTEDQNVLHEQNSTFISSLSDIFANPTAIEELQPGSLTRETIQQLSLKPGSPTIDTGLDTLNVPLDFLDQQRTEPDIGALEYAP